MMRNLMSLTLMAGIVFATPQAGKAEWIDTKDGPVKERAGCSKILSDNISEKQLIAYLKSQWGNNIGRSEVDDPTPGKGSYGAYWRKGPDGKKSTDYEAFKFRRSDRGGWQLTGIEPGNDQKFTEAIEESLSDSFKPDYPPLPIIREGVSSMSFVELHDGKESDYDTDFIFLRSDQGGWQLTHIEPDNDQKFTEAIEKSVSDSFKPDHPPLPIIRDVVSSRIFVELHDQGCIYRAFIRAAVKREPLVKDKTAGMTSEQRQAYDSKMLMLKEELKTQDFAAKYTNDPRFQLMDFYFSNREINFE